MPQDLQRSISEMREIERKISGVLCWGRKWEVGCDCPFSCASGLLGNLKRLQCELGQGGEGGSADGEEMRRSVLLELQRCLCEFREAGDNKVAITSQLLDVVRAVCVCVCVCDVVRAVCVCVCVCL